MHGGLDKPVIGSLVLGHSLVHSLVHSHRSLIRLLRTARYIALIRSLARSLTRSQARGTVEYLCPVFQVFWITVECRVLTAKKKIFTQSLIITHWSNYTITLSFWPLTSADVIWPNGINSDVLMNKCAKFHLHHQYLLSWSLWLWPYTPNVIWPTIIYPDILMSI